MRRLLFVTVVVALLAPWVLGTGAACGPIDTTPLWFCLDPVTGKETSDAPYDETHYVNGEFDPCHCYDPCGSAKTCPILVDAGPPSTDCDAGGDGT